MPPRRTPQLGLLTLILTFAMLGAGLAPTHLSAQPPPPPVEITPTDTTLPVDESTTPAPDLAEPEPALPDGYQPPAELAGLSTLELADLVFPSQIQGDIQLDLVVGPERITAGQPLTYTYIITNTRNTPVSDLIVEARWTNFKLTNASNLFQFCRDLSCAPLELAGHLPIKLVSATDSLVTYRVDKTLAAGESGRFSVVLATRTDQYPRTGQPPNRPAGSSQVRTTQNDPITSEDTASAMFVGPVFVLSKVASDATKIVNVGDPVEFTITIGNATAAADVIDGRTRSDANPATNIILNDLVPAGSQFVLDGTTPIPQPVNDPTVGPVTWILPGPLNPGGSTQIKVRYFKRDLKTDCGTMVNRTYNVTSDEIPIQTGTTRYLIAGAAANATVRTPLVVSVPTVTPNAPLFGNEVTLTIKVESYWAQPLSGVRVDYQIQPNAWYVPNRANPQPAAAPAGNEMGGKVSWLISLPAGTPEVPASQTITLVLRGDYTPGGTGTATVIAPAGVPSACIVPVNKGVGFQPRLDVSKLPGPDETKNENGQYVVARNEPFTYLIRLTNRDTKPVPNVVLTDLLPATAWADFSYVAGSARLNGQPYEPAPADIINGINGKIIWRNLTVPANASLELIFQTRVNGIEFVDYCNDVQAVPSTNEPVSIKASKVCVRLNPPIRLEKTPSRTTIDGNDANDNKEVTFTIAATNESTEAQDVALHDFGGNFRYLRMVSGPAPTTLNDTLKNYTYEWPRVRLSPGERYEVSFVAVLDPNRCANDRYNNDLKFRYWSPLNGQPYLVVMIPMMRVQIQYTCGTTPADNNLISFNKKLDFATVSLRDRITYTVTAKNENPADGSARTNLVIIDILDENLSYEGMAPTSVIKDEPQIRRLSTNRTELRWVVPSLAANTSTNVQYVARAPDIVGTFSNRAQVTADGMAGVKGCDSWPPTETTKCSGYQVLFEEDQYRIYTPNINVAVAVLASLEPTIDQEVCANPNDPRLYTIKLVNTNRHAYNNTVVTMTLPLGLEPQEGSLGFPPATLVSQDYRGTVLRWSNLSLPQKPGNASSAQLVLEMRLRVGQVLGALQPKVEAYSPDGSIPRKDGEGSAEPTVIVCLPDSRPAIAISTPQTKARVNDEIIYIVTIANPTANEVTLDLETVLDPRVRYIKTDFGPNPAANGASLIWRNTRVSPALSSNSPGIRRIIFRVKALGEGDPVPVQVRVLESSTSLSDQHNTAQIKIESARRNTYLPLVRR